MNRWHWFVELMVSLLRAVAQAAPFFASKDGSRVWDEATGLVGARCSLGQRWTGKTCAGAASQHTFDGAQAAAKRFNVAAIKPGRTNASLIWCCFSISQGKPAGEKTIDFGGYRAAPD